MIMVNNFISLAIHNLKLSKCVLYHLQRIVFVITAHARLMYRETVTVEDAVMAVSVMECSMQVRKANFILFYVNIYQ